MKSARTITHKFSSSLQCLECKLYFIPFFHPSYPSLHCFFYSSLLRFCHSSFPYTLRASFICSELHNTLRCHMQYSTFIQTDVTESSLRKIPVDLSPPRSEFDSRPVHISCGLRGNGTGFSPSTPVLSLPFH